MIYGLSIWVSTGLSGAGGRTARLVARLSSQGFLLRQGLKTGWDGSFQERWMKTEGRGLYFLKIKPRKTQRSPSETTSGQDHKGAMKNTKPEKLECVWDGLSDEWLDSRSWTSVIKVETNWTKTDMCKNKIRTQAKMSWTNSKMGQKEDKMSRKQAKMSKT